MSSAAHLIKAAYDIRRAPTPQQAVDGFPPYVEAWGNQGRPHCR